VPHHFERVGSQITGCSNLYPLNASQSVSKIRLPFFTVSCFTVNKKAPKIRLPVFTVSCFAVNKKAQIACLRFGCWSSLCPVSLF